MTDYVHYTVDGELMRLKYMRKLLAEDLEYGDAAYHISVQDVVRLLQQDGRVVTVFKPAF
ncbi:hypothetical protein KLEP7_gp155 [Pseudaeromonas phage vB_PpeM_ KLEP7]|nr:hypothetical protein KLEP7_gp155 [Pseudaeromonas phage vB_PpeM_ KLEP7]